jgi:hypothetical protein
MAIVELTTSQSSPDIADGGDMSEEPFRISTRLPELCDLASTDVPGDNLYRVFRGR